MKLGRKDKVSSRVVSDSSSDVVTAATNGASTQVDLVEPADLVTPEKGFTEPEKGRHAARIAADGALNAGASVASGLFGEILVERGLATGTQIEQALATQEESGGRLGEILVDMGLLDQRDLAGALAEFFGIPEIDLRRHNPEPVAVALIPEDIAREHLVVPIRLDEDGLHIAVSDLPTDGMRQVLTQTCNQQVRFTFAPETDIRWAIDSSYRAVGGVDKLVQAFEAVDGARKRVLESSATEVVADDAPVVQVVTRILTQAKRDRASDVHIEPSEQVVRVLSESMVH